MQQPFRFCQKLSLNFQPYPVPHRKTEQQDVLRQHERRLFSAVQFSAEHLKQRDSSSLRQQFFSLPYCSQNLPVCCQAVFYEQQTPAFFHFLRPLYTLFLVLSKFKLNTTFWTVCHVKCNFSTTFRTVILFLFLRFFIMFFRAGSIFLLLYKFNVFFYKCIDAFNFFFRKTFYLLNALIIVCFDKLNNIFNAVCLKNFCTCF